MFAKQLKHIKIYFILLVLFGQVAIVFGQAKKMEAFPLSSVQLLESPFKQAQQTDLNYMMSLKPDRLLNPFLREAGITPKDSSYGNWESGGLDGHIGGHYLSALSNMYAATNDPKVFTILNYMIDWLDSCQRKNGDGYVGGVPGGKEMWKAVAAGNVNAINEKWVPWYNLHKLYAGLVDAHEIARIAKAKNILIKLSDWCLNLTANLSEEQMQHMLDTEQGGMNEVFANVASITGDNKYLTLAHRFSHQKILNPLLKDQDALNGLHANTQIPKIIGFERIAQVSGDTLYHHAANFFWQTVVDHKTVSIGGNSVSEHFNPAKDFSSMIESKEGPETCNSYNMLRLTKDLFLNNPEVRYMDYYERTMYNHILSSQNPTGGFVYFTPMRPRHYRVYSKAQEDFWCCVGTGLENHGKYGELVYSYSGADIYVNLFVPSVLKWKNAGITIQQNTKFPFEDVSSITVKTSKSKTFSMYVRYPSWIKSGALKININHQPIAINAVPGTYVAIKRTWKKGDVLAVTLPMHTEAEKLPDGSDWVSFVHGPIVLAAATDSTNLKGMWADGSRMGHVANGPMYPLEDAPMLVTSQKDLASEVVPINDKEFTFSLPNISPSNQYQNLVFKPFFEIQNARYVLYVPATTPQGLVQKQEAIRKAEEAQLALEKITIDKVTAGEQQPETDHNFKGEKTEAGIFNDRHYRHATGWFSYDLTNGKNEAKKIRITYSGVDGGRAFDIYLNEKLLQQVTLENKGTKFYDAEYNIPESIKAEIVVVKFVAHQGSMAGGIYTVRLTK